MALTQEQIEKYKKENPEQQLMAVGDAVFKKPSRAAYDRWVDDKMAGKPSSTNTRQLAQDCIVSPWLEFMAMLEVQPALLLNEVSDTLLTMAGVGGGEAKITAKKL